jgi:GntR family transcriptional regulator
MINIQLDFRSGVPIYTQITDHIRALVEHGDLKPGDQLPTVRQLATELRINFNTVARAYRILDEAGLISTQHGRGTYVWEKPSEETMKQLKKKTLEELTRTYRDEVIRLGYSLEEAIAELKTIQPSGMPSALEDSSEDKQL